MSLVAYTASDGESSTDDAEDDGLRDSLCKPNNDSTIARTADLVVEDEKSENKQPNELMKEDELEDYVKPKSSQSCDVLKPKSKKRKQTMKIGIPALQEDSDEEDDQKSAKKKVPASSVRCGLSSLLPPPVNAAKKEANRILIPHSLKKMPQTKDKGLHIDSNQSSTGLLKASSSSTTAPTVVSHKSLAGDSAPLTKPSFASNYLSLYGSDSDEEEGTSQSPNFFSLDSTRNTVTSQSGKLVNTAPSVPTNICNVQQIDTDNTDVCFAPITHDKPQPTLPDPNAPLSFRTSNTLVSQPYHDPLRMLKPNSSSLMTSVSTQDVPLLPDQSISNSEGPVYHQTEEATSSGEDSDEKSQDVPFYPQAAEFYCHKDDDDSPYQEQNQHLLDKEFLRIQGKQQRGREEIHFVDVSADDHGDNIDLTKSLTEESEYQSHRKKDNMPSSQQKRKKQITYLAFQAKERELTLKNQWANNRMTKKQTQSKYGF